MVEEEERYVEQLHLLISCYLRPFKMAASSKTPPCSHDDVNSIFLNSETVLFLHQIFLKGLTARMESWPTLVLGDLFDMLLPMLSIYQEYVRNHHYSLQVLAECKQSPAFVALLKRLEEKPNCQNRSLETFLTYPMHQIPRYITTLHELLAHTPHNHVERKSLENARTKLEELSRQMHDEVSETENIRKNLSIERMIVEGCDILLDVNQVFVRQGTLIQLPSEKPKGPRNRIGSFKSSSEKEVTRQCFLFTNHIILTNRTSAGRLHLLPGIGKIPLADATLIEDPSEQSIIEDDGESSVCSGSSHSSGGTENQAVASKNDYQSLDFKLIIDVKSGSSVIIHLLAPTLQEKNAWISDISHCMDNVHFNDLFHGSTTNTSSVTMPQSIRNDPRLFKDDIDIRFSRTLNSCKVPQIRYATPERLLERLTDLRFLSIDFLNTFLLTYRVFTNSVTVLEALKHVYYNPEVNDSTPSISDGHQGESSLSPSEYENMRRISTSSVVSSIEAGESERDRSFSHDVRNGIQVQHWRWSHRKFEEEQQHREANELSNNAKNLTSASETPDKCLNNGSASQVAVNAVQTNTLISDSNLLNVPSTLITSTSSDTLTETAASSPSTPQTLSTSTNTLIAETQEETVQEEIVIMKDIDTHSKQLQTMSSIDSTSASELEEESPISPPPDVNIVNSQCLPPSHSSQNIQINYYTSRRIVMKRGSADTSTESSITSPRSSFQHSESPQHSSRAGVVITSHRASQRRSSTSSAAAAFAVATAGSSNPRDLQTQTPRGSIGHRYSTVSTVSTDSRLFYRERYSIGKRESIISTAATMRVLNVLRHWVSKHSQDFESDSQLKSLTVEFLEELLSTASLLPVEQKAASQLLRMITRENLANDRVDLDMLLATPATPSKENIETLQALEIAEQMTYLDHKIFISIKSEEFLGQAWNKSDKTLRAPHIHLMSQRFNHVSRLVASEIIQHSNLSSRIAVIEKWTAVADICRCFHNFNGVFQIASAFECSAVFRLKKTWEKVPKAHRQTIEKIKNLASYDGRFRNLRESLHRCDPPCIPFLGMYLSDLSFIEEGTPNFTDDNLLNFSKMRMIAHVIRDVRRFQQTPYKIEWNMKVANYLLDPSLLLSDEELYNTSLAFEPRTSRLGSISHT